MNQTILSRFCLCRNFGAPVQTSWAQIKEVMQSPQVVNICQKISNLDSSAENYEQLKKHLKTKLPAITVHACYFENQQRHNDNAWWNGLVCLEYDHLTTDEIEAFRQIEPPYSGIVLAGKSCSATGVWMLIEVPHSDYKQMKSTLEEIHLAYTAQMKQKGFDISQKVDIQLDLARLRFLPAYDYIFWDLLEDFQDKQSMIAGYNSMYGDIIDACAGLEKDIPQGQRHNTYKQYAAKISKITDNKNAMLRFIPSLGLSAEERMGVLNWAKEKITTTQKTEEKTSNIHMLPIDNEALPFPDKKCPKLIRTLVKDLCKSWKKSASLCLLPALSAACGELTQQDETPLVFQVALYGLSQSGKTKFSAKPANFVMEYIAQNDNEYRKIINKDKEGNANVKCPKVLPFTDSSKVQIMKYLQYAKNQTVMAYEGDLSASITGKESAFLNLKDILRKGFDGERILMDYKDADSCRGSVKARLSALVIGTP